MAKLRCRAQGRASRPRPRRHWTETPVCRDFGTRYDRVADPTYLCWDVDANWRVFVASDRFGPCRGRRLIQERRRATEERLSTLRQSPTCNFPNKRLYGRMTKEPTSPVRTVKSVFGKLCECARTKGFPVGAAPSSAQNIFYRSYHKLHAEL